MCRSQTFSSVEFLLIKLLSVSVIRKPWECSKGRERSAHLVLSLQSSVWITPTSGSWRSWFLSRLSQGEKTGTGRVRAGGSVWPGVQPETFRQNLPSLDTHFTLSSPSSPAHLTFLSKDTLSRPSSLPLLSHPSALFFPPFFPLICE